MARSLQETVREDGLRVITKKLKIAKSVIVSVSALGGCAYDPQDKTGLFHFFEHMAFKGTKTKSMHEIKEALGRLVMSNAGTHNLRTTYWGEAVHTKLPLLQEIVFDIYLNPVFPPEEIEKEKEVVLNEAAMYEDNDNHKAWYLLYGLLWEHNPQRRLGVGIAAGLSNINRGILLETHKKWYQPSNTIVVAVGRIDHDKFLNDVNDSFPFVAGKVVLSGWGDEADQPPFHKAIIVERKNREKGVVVWGCKVPKLSDREIDAGVILSNMLGGGFDSLLWTEVREKRGLVYSVHSYFDVNGLGNYFGFVGTMLPPRLDEVKDLICDVICNYNLNEAHFCRAREVIEDEHLLSLEDSHDWNRTIHNRIIDDRKDISILNNYIARRIKRLQSITFEEVLEMRRKLITPERLACAVVKPC
ncbi:hypothetical protein A3G55_02660 [Candidatus Giovannonibacteria bacterium RIFCSPLOWO2_12_FULL_44_25]|nr:MAG: Processing protease [Parcubacteria group bacterium GW2011_GWC1_44_10]KKT57051.1 MAG: Processing protease [Candidatus Giovannonibacteria bacterium GW2011_GWB1_44_23]KKT59488.1 MAG: Processing protease [Candidatus Giovannonibacteria bacterium GW2011_GWA1_44_25]OGF87898.1 MAG: hypothetical protein A3I36_02350 [Candidatus Giovannonibacteria bacterium RIFCSPLOWO2_02_FULL_45_28]OGF95334.1 MAG: hypothetical protein A3G55_02660 [Candidatus Giovannonibacteria bacterium RIFCSPLOWO2_12_FULL_44_25]